MGNRQGAEGRRFPVGALPDLAWGGNVAAMQMEY